MIFWHISPFAIFFVCFPTLCLYAEVFPTTYVITNMLFCYIDAGEHAFKGRTTDTKQMRVPMATLQAAGAQLDTQNIVMQKEGAGR